MKKDSLGHLSRHSKEVLVDEQSMLHYANIAGNYENAIQTDNILYK